MTRPPRERTSAVAREIAPDVYCLGPQGCTQTDVYFVRSGSSWALVDIGWAKDGPSIKGRRGVRVWGRRPSSLDPADPLPPRPCRLGTPTGADLGLSGLRPPRRASAAPNAW